MDIFINQGEYTGLTDEAGVRVVLIDQTRMPFPFHEGFSVPTGFSTSVGIKKVELQICTNLCNVLHYIRVVKLKLNFAFGRENQRKTQ